MIHIFQCLKIEPIFSSKTSGHCVEKTEVRKNRMKSGEYVSASLLVIGFGLQIAGKKLG